MSNISFSHRISEQELGIVRKFIDDVPVKVGALADALGLKVVVAALPLNISGLIQPDDTGGFVIKVNRFESKERQRFTIAHEIAHFLLHRDRLGSGIIDSTLYRSKLSSRLEAEANRLAADIIMPDSKVREFLGSKTYTRSENIVDSLAQIFNVSKQAMAIRTGE